MRKTLSASGFARLIQRDPKTVINWIQGAKRVGNQYQIPVKELERYQQAEQYPPEKWHK